MRRSLDLFYALCQALAALSIVAIAGVVICQVLLNLLDRLASKFFNEAIGLTIPSYADFTGFFLASASFLALAGTLRGGDHIRVTIITGALPFKFGRMLQIVSVVFCTGIAWFAAWYALSLTAESLEFGDMSSGLVAVPLWIPQSVMTFGLFALGVALVDELWSLLQGRKAEFEKNANNLLDQKLKPKGGD